MQRLAIIGASYLQLPLIKKAQEMGYETHVFAWAAGDVGETAADRFYPISIREKDQILEKCRELNVCGVCSIASDLAIVTVNYVADGLGLVGNPLDATDRSSNKFLMRQCFFRHGVPSPKSVHAEDFASVQDTFRYPLIVKPADRSGSRGISRISDPAELEPAVSFARQESFSGEVLIEEFAEGEEYSIECISWEGKHTLLAATWKFTTGAPTYIERCHLQPAPLDEEMLDRIRDITFFTLDCLGIRNGASHTELKIAPDGTVNVIEVGGRMGGGTIGSDLVELTTGADYVRMVIDIAVGKEPDISFGPVKRSAAVRFVFTPEDLSVLESIRAQHPEYIVEENLFTDFSEAEEIPVRNDSERLGYYILAAETSQELLPYLQP